MWGIMEDVATLVVFVFIIVPLLVFTIGSFIEAARQKTDGPRGEWRDR